MLEELRALIGSVDDADNYWVRLHSVDDIEDIQDGLDLELTVTIAGQQATRWRIRCSSVAECRIKDWGGSLDLDESGHVTALQYAEPVRTLMFRTRPTSSTRCVGKMWVAHWHAAGPWIPFERYTNCYKA